MRLTRWATPLAAMLVIGSLAAGGLAYGANSCARECSADYRADVCACHQIGAEDDGGDNRTCVQEARDDYGTCLGDCFDPLEPIVRNNAVSGWKAQETPEAFRMD